MTQHTHWLRRAGHVGTAVLGLRPGPVPRPAMLRSGGAIGLGFVIFLALGQLEAALVCAVFTNFLCLSDRADDLGTRVWVQILGALLSTAAGAVGIVVAGNEPLILVTTFALALFAGFVHGTAPGVEAIPRYALACFVVAAFLPVAHIETLWAILGGTALAIGAVVIDHHIRHGRRGRRIERMRAAVKYPGPRFSFVYGSAAVCGLALGLVWGQTRPYWATITTLLVMQPDRRANTVRVIQRFLGTLFGVVLAFLIVRLMPSPVRPQGLLILVIVLPFLWPLGFDRNYGLGVAILSTWVLILIDTALPEAELVTPLFLARLSDTAIGCAVALAGSFVVYEATEDEDA
jgi:hypothetical protein